MHSYVRICIALALYDTGSTVALIFHSFFFFFSPGVMFVP